jgi:hypothetical protein
MYFHHIPYIAPIGMMVHFFRVKSHFGHKSEGLGEIFEFKCSLQRIIFLRPHGLRFFA